MLWSLGFSERLKVNLRVCFVSGEDSILCFKDSLQDFFWWIPIGQFHLVPTDIQVAVLSSPTEQALLCTVEQSWRHLDALVAIYAVELLFVTGSTGG